MSDGFWYALPGIIGAFTSFYVAFRQMQMKTQIQEVKHLTNSLKDELVAKTDVEAHARGVLDEKQRNIDAGG